MLQDQSHQTIAHTYDCSSDVGIGACASLATSLLVHTIHLFNYGAIYNAAMVQ